MENRKGIQDIKHDLKIRPIYHRLQRRIEAHITINFAAYKVYKELERLLVIKHANITCEQSIEIAKTIYSIKITDPATGNTSSETLLLNDEQNIWLKSSIFSLGVPVRKTGKAAMLLKAGDYNVTEVAYMLGYNDIRYFSTTFKKYYGKSPSIYQKEFREKSS